MDQTQSPLPDHRVPNGKAGGIAIVVASVVMLFSIMHHPTSKAMDPAGAIATIVQLAAADRIVHATVMATMLALTFGFAVYSLRRGLHRSAVIAAFVSFALGVGTTIIATLVDGFLVPAIAERYAGATLPVMNQAGMLLGMCGSIVQITTKAGLVGMSIAILLWSVDLLGETGLLRTAAIVGIVSGIAPAALTLWGGYLNPHVLIVIVAVQMLWYLAIAAALLQRRV